MRDLLKLPCVLWLIFLSIVCSFAFDAVPGNFYYNPDDIANRYYLYQSGGQNILDHYREIVSVSNPALKELARDPHYFLAPVNLWESKNYFFLTNSQLLGHLFEKETLFQLKEYVIRKLNPSFLKLILADGTREVLARDDQRLSVWTTTSNTALIKTVSVPDQFQLQYIYSKTTLPNPDYTQSGDDTGTILISPNAALSVPEHTIAVWEGELSTMNLIILQTNTGKYYTFINRDDAFYSTNRYKILRVGAGNVIADNNCYIKPGKTLYSFAPVPAGSLKQYYFIMQNNSRKPENISDLCIIRLAFPKDTKYPIIISDRFYPSGSLLPQDAMLARENAGKQVIINSGQASHEQYAYGTLSIKNSAFPHPLRKDGHICANKYYPQDVHYQDRSFAFFIPPAFDISNKFHFLIYLHGRDNNVNDVLNRDKLVQQITASGKNIILIIPALAKNAKDPFGGWLEEPNGFTKMLSEIKISLAAMLNIDITALNRGRIIIAAYDGGQSPLSGILMHGGERIDQVYLFDGLSKGNERLLFWQERYPNSKLVVLYTDNSKTARKAETLYRTIKGFNLTDRAVKLALPTIENNTGPLPSLSDKRTIVIDAGSTSSGKLVGKGYLELLLKNLVAPSAK
ncbi:hypothetical protein ACFL57_03760 [Candidatus Margulisiibacteriota bacterium]